jgi:trehalose/maltose transport system substrate-binding protein
MGASGIAAARLFGGVAGAQDATPAAVPAGLRTDLAGETVKMIAGNSSGPAYDFDLALAAEFEAVTGIKVERVGGSNNGSELLATYLQQLGAQADDIDVYQIDVIWPGMLAPHAVDLSDILEAQRSQGVEHFERIVANNTVEGKLVGVPFYTDAGVLFYRTDLLEKYGFTAPPATWAELEQQAQTIQDGERAANPDFWGFVWTGKAFEGLTCCAYEWQISQGGGKFVEDDGTVSVNNEATIAAFNRAKGWIGTITPPGVTTYEHEEPRGVFQAGNAAFMRNWPYAYALGQAPDSPIAGKLDISILPKGEQEGAVNADALGGWQLLVSNYSKHQDAAKEWVKFMTSPEIQKRRSIALANIPTLAPLYEDAEVLAANPYYERMLPVFQGGAAARPSTITGEFYNDVSTAYFTGVSQILSGEKDAAEAVADIEEQINEALEG